LIFIFNDLVNYELRFERGVFVNELHELNKFFDPLITQIYTNFGGQRIERIIRIKVLRFVKVVKVVKVIRLSEAQI